MTSSSSQPICGTAAGVPFTALLPRDDAAHAPLVVTWHLMDPPCTDSAMAAALVNPLVRVAGAIAAHESASDVRYEWTDVSRVRWHSVTGMPHHLAEPPGVEPAPQNVHAAAVDAAFTSWFAEHLGATGPPAGRTAHRAPVVARRPGSQDSTP